MKRMIASFLACIAGLLVSATAGRAQEKPPKEPLPRSEVFAALRKNLDTLGKGLAEAKLAAKERSQADELLVSVHDSVRGLEKATLDQDVPKPYLLSLTRDSWMLEKSRTLLGKDGDEKEKGFVLLKSVAADLQLKKASTGAVKGATRLVKVVAETKDATGQGEGGCEVWCVVQGMVDYPEAYERFPKLSTPTPDDLAPGAYFFWTEKGGKKGKRTPGNVRDDGTGQWPIDIPTP
jgi:hypothetical protein